MATRTNPIATDDQHEIERRGLELFSHPRVVSTLKEVKEYWIASNEPSPEMLACLNDWAFEEVMFAAMIWSLNQDPLYPRVITITRLEHELGGTRIPGTRWGIDNPDSVYRVIPISGAEKYVIRGKVASHRLTENYFTLWDDKMNSVDVLNGKDLVLEPDGSFEIFVDSDPAGARPNHIRSAPEAHEFYIRDVVMDWGAEMINELSIERLGAEPSRPPFSLDEQLDLTTSYLWKWAKESDRWNAQAGANAPNDLAYTIDRDIDGALRNQIYKFGKFALASDEEALVLDVNLGGAEYFIAPISNDWGTTNDVLHRTGSLNRAQSAANSDGTYTYVLSVQDPGVHNWLDPTGFHEGTLTLRWAEFAGGQPGPDLGVKSRIVLLRNLRSELPPETLYLTEAERRAQLAERTQSYSWRLAEK